jgi:phospholipid/cholesterol/gamma-HCH transport system ATP-binding protein
MIEIIDVHKSFGGQSVLRGVNLKFDRGRITAVIGRSGGGKTVLLKHILRLMRPDSGSILIDGVDIARLRRRALSRVRGRFGVLFQGGALFDSLTIFDNVAFPLREAVRAREPDVRRRVKERLAAVGLADAGDKYLSEISGGMRKRVALARALACDPEFILFDEPTTGLDPILLRSVHRLIRSVHAQFGFTGVVISHEVPEIFDIADSVALLDEGYIAEQAAPATFLASKNPLVQKFLQGINGEDQPSGGGR